MKKRILLCLFLTAVLLLSACGASEKETPGVEAYAQEHWGQYAPLQYDESSGVLTLSMHSTMSYSSACEAGASVYEGQLAPDTYLDTVRIIALEIAGACGIQHLTVTLQCLSSDGSTIFTVSSDGSVWSCWE